MHALASALTWLPQLLLAFGVVLFLLYRWLWSAAARQRRAMRRVPTSSISSSPPGALVRIVGVIEVMRDVDNVISAPFTQRACVYYSATVRQQVARNSWREVAKEERGTSFCIRDESGTAHIVLDGAHLDVAADFASSSGVFTDPDEMQRRFLDAHAVKKTTTILGVNHNFRFHERVLALGERVAVLGVVKHEPAGEEEGTVDAPQDYRGSAKKLRVTIVAPSNGNIAVSDDPSITRVK